MKRCGNCCWSYPHWASGADEEVFCRSLFFFNLLLHPTGLEALVHTDPVRSQVSPASAETVSPVLLRFLSRSWFLRSYLHSCEPAIIHGNLTCDTIFIQHNGLIKIGSGRKRTSMEDGSPPHACAGLIEGVSPPHFPVAPDTINNHVKTCREEKKSLHFFAPEYGGKVIFCHWCPHALCGSSQQCLMITSFVFSQLLPTLPQPWIFIPLECAP